MNNIEETGPRKNKSNYIELAQGEKANSAMSPVGQEIYERAIGKFIWNVIAH
jgi:hypothetical protein